MSDLATAPSAAEGASAPVAEAPAASSPAEGASSKSAETKAPSAREAMRMAMEKVNAASSETNQAAAVLKEGAGADEKLKTDAEKALTSAADAERAATDASERAKKGWETRRANQDKTEAETRQAETIQKTAQEAAKAAAEAVQPKPTEQPKPAETKYPDAPKWMTKAVAAEWAKLPESVREEVVKRSEAFDKGIEQYKTGADRWNELGDFEKLSQEHYKRPLKETLSNYVELDKLLSTDLLAGLERIVGSRGWKDDQGKYHPFTLKQIAEHVMAQEGVETFNNESMELNRKLDAALRKIDELEKGQTRKQESEAESRRSSIQKQIDTFAKEAPRWAELEGDIAKVLKSDLIDRTGDPVADLKAAYEFADKRLKPAPSLSPPAPELPAPDPEAQTRKGTASVSGAPGSGSNPAVKKPSPQTARDAIKMAMAKVGVA